MSIAYFVKNTFPSSQISPALSLLPLLSVVLSFLQALSVSHDKDQLSAGFTPSRVSGIPTATLLIENAPLPWIPFCYIVITVFASVAIGAFSLPLLHPPPPPPPVAPASENDADDDEAIENNDGGDDDPQEDGGGADNENGRDEAGLATAAAPAPEDPPPPPGGVEEHGDNRDNSSASDNPLLWLVLLLLGKLSMGLFTRKETAKPSIKVDHIKRDIVKPAEPAAQRPPSSRIPGLLERQVRVVNDDPALEFCAAPKPPSFIAGLLQRRPHPPVPRPIPPAPIRQDLLPVPEQRVWDAPPPRALPSIATALRRARLPWRKLYTLVVVLSGFAFVGAVATIILLVPRATPIAEDAHAQVHAPEPPPPNPWQDMRRRIRAALFRHIPATDVDKDTRAQAVQFLQRATARRAARPAPADGQEDAERHRVEQIREVQRRVWRLLCELVVPGPEGGEGEEVEGL
ncbi:hypothetical protein DFH09DRAFT_1404316 [Mycena vulgaris]|nr:hypothetical protein DFH09DRAFT_1404316 [Mycena vulgaris]